MMAMATGQEDDDDDDDQNHDDGQKTCSKIQKSSLDLQLSECLSAVQVLNTLWQKDTDVLCMQSRSLDLHCLSCESCY